ncbi:hypothetical protein JCM19992_34620 [Thermostilla marina]
MAQVARTPGLIAFWDFSHREGATWGSYYDPQVVDRSYPVYLRRIGDPKRYPPDDWPYHDEDARLTIDTSGPFGHAVRFNQGFIFGEVPRAAFDGSPLDICGSRPFTLIAWMKFVGKRHMIAGIWDEGGWKKYGGRRQIALFGGLFGSRGVIGNISATGAASYPQSTAPGSQYARCRAVDGRGFDNHRWTTVAMTFDPQSRMLTVYCNGKATPCELIDPVAADVFGDQAPPSANPYHFPWPIYSPRAFVLKFNGYDAASGVYEHWLQIDTVKRTVAYHRSCVPGAAIADSYRVRFAVEGAGPFPPASFEAKEGAAITLPPVLELRPGVEIVAALEVQEGGTWRRVGDEIRYPLREGAPFTFGRALGLGDEPIAHGSQLFIDGAAVFNRVLSADELKSLAFVSE